MQLQDSTDARIDQTDAAVADLAERVEAIEDGFAAVKAGIAQLRQGLAVAEAAPSAPPPSNHRDNNRNTDPTLVTVRLLDAVALAALQKVVDEFVHHEMQLDAPAVKLSGRPLDKAFTIQFQCAPGLAAARVDKFLLLQKGPEGGRLHARPPSRRLRPLSCVLRRGQVPTLDPHRDRV